MGTGYTVPMGTQSRRAARKRSTAAAVAMPPQEPPAREEEILRAAFDVFTEKGFHGARMLDVASVMTTGEEVTIWRNVVYPVA